MMIPAPPLIIWPQLIILNWMLAVRSCIGMKTQLPNQSLKTKFPFPTLPFIDKACISSDVLRH